MILPISEDGAPAQRTPWLTLGLIALLTACFLAAGGARRITGQDDAVELEQAIDYWLEHPYLDARPEVVDAAAFANGYSDGADFVARVRARGELPPVDAEVLAQEQLGLSYLTTLALRGTDAKPGPAHVFRRFGLDPSTPRAHALVTHVLWHAGWLHLGLVVLVIWLVGPALERRLGWQITAGVCLVGAFAPALTQVARASETAAPLVGASGVAAALLGAFAARFGTTRVSIRYVTLHEGRPTTLARDTRGWALLVAGLFVQVALCLIFLDSAVASGNAWTANLAALVTGAATVVVLQRFKAEERLAKATLDAGTHPKVDARIKRATTARERGKHAEAIALADEVLRERPEDIDGLQASWDAHVAAGRAGDGARSARRLVELHARRGDLASAARLWDELLRVAHRGRVEPTTLLRIVPELVVQARRDAAIAALRAVVDSTNTSLTVGQALRVAELGAELDPPSALVAARHALERGELVDERRARLEQLVLSLENSGVRAKASPAVGDDHASAEVPPAGVENEPAESAAFALDRDGDSGMLGLVEEPSAGAVEPPPPPSELFELEPTQLGVEPAFAAVPLPRPAPAAPASPAPSPSGFSEDASATVLFSPERPATSASASFKITPVLPVALDVAGLRVRLEGGAPSLIEWARVQAIGVGLVSGLGPNPVVVIDLALNWADAPEGALELMRLRSDGFRARQLVTGAANPLEAMRALLAELLARSGAVPLPDPAGARGTPFREYASLDAYQGQVLLATH